ncbi:PREDICTED: auxin-responsive protein SAUR63-like [Camelina sativa]|uniref:Auxin-responsive protein SAUR63-like n=1 Tax=Camelina sativa TaxID=90675 RepID=A0ABM0WZ99_CAMSA|nr:PREDICTED: auxin-responsive protein SAUR63-like [Camelina sativa]
MAFFINKNFHSKSSTKKKRTHKKISPSFSLHLTFRSKSLFKMMMNTKKLIKMAKKWQHRAALSRKRISFQKSSATPRSSAAVEKGCFVVYTADNIRFAFPISYLSNSIVQELLKISEEEFGLPTEGPITLPFDSSFLEYIIKMIQRRIDGDTEKALLLSISTARCSLQQQQFSINQQLLVF